jgi:hypothetical protein
MNERHPARSAVRRRLAGHTRWSGAALTLLAAASVALVSLAGAAPASAAPSGPLGNAFVWANDPTAASYTPSATYQYNSTAEFQTVNTINRTGTGSYTVLLPNLGTPSGTVLVNAYGFTANSCKVASWGPSGTTQTINVRCFNPAGQLADTQFSLSYNNWVGGGSDIGYVWANQPTSASYTPATNYQGNSSGADNQVTRWATGSYQVWLPNLGQSAGHVEVTAYGYGSERCKVTGWGPSGTTQVVGVACFTTTGVPVDTLFTLTYVRDTNILGNNPVCCEPDGFPTAYVWAHDPTSASYVPSSTYQFSDFGARDQISVNRLSTGYYAVHDGYVTFSAGNVQVTAYGSGSEYCHVAYWTPTDGIRVLCYDASGNPVDTLYDASYTAGFVIG